MEDYYDYNNNEAFQGELNNWENKCKKKGKNVVFFEKKIFTFFRY